MKVKTSVYGSQNEKELFQTLHSHWSDKFDIFLSLPLANILEAEPADLTNQEKSLFYKTSVDYTLCEKSGRPVFSIEFDGMGHGFSRQHEYVQVVPISNAPHRKLKMDAKLRWCSFVSYPLIVVSYEEKNPLINGIDLTVVDGIIGQFIASTRSGEEIRNYDWDKECEGLSPEEAHKKIQDMVIDMGIVAELEDNPLVHKAAELEHKASELGLVKSASFYPINEPELPDGMNIKERIHDFDSIVMKVGYEIEVETPFGKISEKVMIRNLSGIIEPSALAQEISSIKIFSKILKIYDQKRRKKGHA